MGEIRAEGKFKAGKLSKDIPSMGKLHREGYDIIFSGRWAVVSSTRVSASGENIPEHILHRSQHESALEKAAQGSDLDTFLTPCSAAGPIFDVSTRPAGLRRDVEK